MNILPFYRLSLESPLSATEVQERLITALEANEQTRFRDTLMSEDLFFPVGQVADSHFKVYGKFYWLQKHDLQAKGNFSANAAGGSEIEVKISYRYGCLDIAFSIIAILIISIILSALIFNRAPLPAYLLLLFVLLIGYISKVYSFRINKEKYVIFFIQLFEAKRIKASSYTGNKAKAA